MANSITPFLMFQGTAEEAMTLYATLFPDSAVVGIERYGPGEAGAEGKVKRAQFRLGGVDLICIDSPVRHAFTFTPSISLFVDCGSEAEFQRTVGVLSEGGEQLMPPGDYGFSGRYCWLNDRFGVSWQLSLA